MKIKSSAISSKNIGLRRENINKCERRAPLIPAHVGELIGHDNLDVYVQPSSIRAFEDSDYRREGARIEENLCPCRLIFGLKEIPLKNIEKEKVYAFFSHTIKGQPHNMPMLKRMMDLGCSIVDYEKIVDHKGRRLLFFGGFAGKAGMVDTLWALGKRLEIEGIKTPFLRLSETFRYKSLIEAKEEVAEVGRLIYKKGLPARLAPLVCGFLGYGHVSQGAQEIFDLMPVEQISPQDLPALFRRAAPSARGLYKVVFSEKDMVRPIAPLKTFNLEDYYRTPQKYAPIVEEFLPYLTILINGIYWTPRFPKFVTQKFLRRVYGQKKNPRLKVIGDISCDINGSIESTIRSTDSENPVYVYDVLRRTARPGFRGRGPVVMAVYNLPAELPLESSAYFSERLKAFVPVLAGADFQGSFSHCRLPPELKKAVILFRGKLTPAYRYLSQFVS